MLPITRRDPAVEYALRRGPGNRVSLIAFRVREVFECTWSMVSWTGGRELIRRAGMYYFERGVDHASRIVEEAHLRGEFGWKGADRFDRVSRGDQFAMLLDFYGHPSPAQDEFVAEVGPASWWGLMNSMPPSTIGRIDDVCGRAAVDEFFATWPFLAASLSAASAEAIADLVSVRDRTDRLARMLTDFDFGGGSLHGHPDRDRIESGVRHLLKRNRGVGCSGPFPGFPVVMRLAGAVPPDWLPYDDDSFDEFVANARDLARMVKSSSHCLDLATLAASSKGRWQEFRRRMAPMQDWTWEVGDMACALARQLVQPILYHLMAREFPAPVGGPRLVRDEVFRWAAHAGVSRDGLVRQVCIRLLFDGMAAPAIRRANQTWHARRAAMDARIGTPKQATWATPFDAIAISEEAELTAISNASDLAAEGKLLRHCVGGYYAKCMNKTSVIASIRRAAAGGRLPTSTVEFSGWSYGEPWKPRVLQHRSFRNDDPSEEDVRDLDIAMRAISGLPVPSLPPGQEDTVPGMYDAAFDDAGYEWTDPARLGEAFSAWEVFLARGVRKAGVEGLSAEIVRLCGPEGLSALRGQIETEIDRWREYDRARQVRARQVRAQEEAARQEEAGPPLRRRARRVMRLLGSIAMGAWRPWPWP